MKEHKLEIDGIDITSFEHNPIILRNHCDHDPICKAFDINYDGNILTFKTDVNIIVDGHGLANKKLMYLSSSEGDSKY